MPLFLIVLMAVLNQMSFSGTRITVSLYALSQGESQIVVGIIIALFSLLPTFLAIPIGQFADRSSPHRLMMQATVANLLLLLIPFGPGGMPALCLMALLLGITHILFLVPFEAAMGGYGGSERRVRNYSFLTMGWSFSNFFGPVIAGISIDQLGHKQAFLVQMAITAASLAMLYFMRGLIPEKQHGATKDEKKEPRGSVMELWRMAPVRATLIASSVVGAAMDLFQFYFPVYGHSIGLSASAIGAIIGTVSAAAFVVRGILPHLVKFIPEPKVIVYSAYITAIAFFCVPFTANPYLLGCAAFILGLGVGTTNPLAMSLLFVLTPPQRIAEATGANKAIRSFSHVAVPLIAGGVGSALGFTTVFLAVAVMMVGGGWLVESMKIPANPAKTKHPKDAAT